MKNRVSLVLVPIDDFTDKVIIDKPVNMKIDGDTLNKPLKKVDGFFVFTNIMCERVVVTVSAYSYNSRKMEIDINKLNKLNPVVKVRLKPNNIYNFPKETTCIEGTAEPGTKIEIVYRCAANLFMLFKDNEKGESKLKIYNPLSIDLEGKTFIIGEKSKNTKREEFTIISYDEKNDIYILDKALKKSYEKESCEILKVDYIDVFDDGKVFFPLKNFTDENNDIVIKINEHKKEKINLTYGIINKIEI
ncbi:hypothetical protein [uncultured Clostridium sp.]|uniref:hypothetical protein n=1 Tax=uncultured Clostridium sp. TaxID=59620 RepID=UPI0025FD7F88|nr:hypothetical protein [uncultured Clostridium sp.]